MKKEYSKPEIWEVFMEDIAAQVTSINSNAGLVIGGGSTEPAYAKEKDLFFDEDEEEKEIDLSKWIDLEQYVQK